MKSRAATVGELEGCTVTKIDGKVGDDELVFHLSDGRKFRMYHMQDCCESVSVEDITGELDWLLNGPIVSAVESTSNENPSGVTKEYQDSFTWTFYKLATERGMVDIRWYGQSNGYYSESVDCEFITA